MPAMFGCVAGVHNVYAEAPYRQATQCLHNSSMQAGRGWRLWHRSKPVSNLLRLAPSAGRPAKGGFRWPSAMTLAISDASDAANASKSKSRNRKSTTSSPLVAVEVVIRAVPVLDLPNPDCPLRLLAPVILVDLPLDARLEALPGLTDVKR